MFQGDLIAPVGPYAAIVLSEKGWPVYWISASHACSTSEAHDLVENLYFAWDIGYRLSMRWTDFLKKACPNKELE